jgi:hypothetical protein
MSLGKDFDYISKKLDELHENKEDEFLISIFEEYMIYLNETSYDEYVLNGKEDFDKANGGLNKKVLDKDWKRPEGIW